MRERIRTSILTHIMLTVIVAFSVMIAEMYYEARSSVRRETSQEAEYLSDCINHFGGGYIEQLGNLQNTTRATVISPEGQVLYDSVEDEASLQNHNQRPEIIAALAHGTGTALRRSDSMKEQQFYYAKRLDDGNILCLSRNLDTIFSIALNMAPAVLLVTAIITLIAIASSRREANRLVRPINELDLNDPLKNEVYEELQPLLLRIDEQNRETAANENLRKEFSANVSHELKTPLTSISGYAEIMKEGLVREEDIPKFSEKIYSEAQRLMRLIDDIIRLSKLDENAVYASKEMIDLYDVANAVCERLTDEALRRNVRITMSGHHESVLGIRQPLDEMVYNICENAIKYNKDNGKVDVWVGREDGVVTLRVKDTGIGIPDAEQERVFERFYRVDKSHSKETGGTGLGLSIVKHSALLHGAEITLASHVGVGTVITVAFIS